MIRELAEKKHIILIFTYDQEFVSCVCRRAVRLTTGGNGREAQSACSKI